MDDAETTGISLFASSKRRRLGKVHSAANKTAAIA